jgi:hypothetical protein
MAAERCTGGKHGDLPPHVWGLLATDEEVHTVATSDEREEQGQPETVDMGEIYDRYVKPLEDEHWGEFVAVSKDGRVLLGRTAREVTFAAKDTFGPGNYIYKIGPRVVGRI